MKGGLKIVPSFSERKCPGGHNLHSLSSWHSAWLIKSESIYSVMVQWDISLPLLHT